VAERLSNALKWIVEGISGKMILNTYLEHIYESYIKKPKKKKEKKKP